MKSLLEIREILSTYTTGPIVLLASRDALAHAERFRDLAIELRAGALKCTRDEAAEWVDSHQ